MSAGGGLAKVQEKRRNGLLRLWAFERLTGALARLGLTLHVSVIYREAPLGTKAPKPGLHGCTTAFAEPADLADVAAVDAYPFSEADLAERMANGAECFLLRHTGAIVAFTWLRFDDPPHRLGLLGSGRPRRHLHFPAPI